MSRARLDFFLSHIYLFSLLHTYPDIFKYGGCFLKRFRKRTFPYLAHSNRYRPSTRKGQTMETRQHTLEGMGRMMYNVIIFQDLRFRPSTLKRLVSVFKIVTLGTVFKTSVFGAQIRHAQKLRLLLDGKKILVFKMKPFQSRLLNFGLVLFII